MSGDLVYSVNNQYARYQGGGETIGVAIVFTEFLKYFNSHSNFDFAGYGTGSSQTGTTPPSSWRTWEYRSDSVPFGDNSWFVVNATSASKGMDGSGDYQWQAKFQVTQSSSFDDCSGSDYGFEGDTYTLCCRSSADGGWNSGTCDFSPASGADASDNYRVCAGDTVDTIIDIVGDDDTVFWRTMVSEGAWSVNDYCKQGYLGIYRRRSSHITKPFFMMVGASYHGYAGEGTDGSRNAANESTTGYNWLPQKAFDWPTYSLASDGTTKITSHWKGFRYAWTYWRSTEYRYGDYKLFWRIPIREYESPNDYNYLGELSLLIQTDHTIGRSTVIDIDDSDISESGCYLQFCDSVGEWTGVAMKYPSGVNNLW
jgi:hypothetical protein